MSVAEGHFLLQAAHDSYERRLRAMQSIADVNRASVMACLDPDAGFCNSDPTDAALVASSVVYGIASLRLLLDANRLYALDLECANDCVEAEQLA